MPFTPHKGSLDPQTLSVLQAAFDDAWSKVLRGKLDGFDEQSARHLIAKRIVDAAIDLGERDPDALSRYALTGFPHSGEASDVPSEGE